MTCLFQLFCSIILGLFQTDSPREKQFVRIDHYSSQTIGTCSVASDGDCLIVGNAAVHSESGVAVIFQRHDNRWTTEQIIRPDHDGVQGFGASVEIISDAVLIGAPMMEGNDRNYCNCVYIYKHLPQSIGTPICLRASDESGGNSFGWAIAANDRWLAVGAPTARNNNANSGAVYLFKNEGGNWIQSAKLITSDGENGDWFGSTVAIRGTTLAAGCPKRTRAGEQHGAVYIFRFNGAEWVETQILQGDAPADHDSFGWSISLSDSRMAIGSPYLLAVQPKPGRVATFRLDGNCWEHEHSFVAPDGFVGDSFGAMLATDGKNILVMAPEAHDSRCQSSAFYLADTSTAGDVDVHRLPHLNGLTAISVGNAAEINGDDAIIVGKTFSPVHETYLIGLLTWSIEGVQSTAEHE